MIIKSLKQRRFELAEEFGLSKEAIQQLRIQKGESNMNFVESSESFKKQTLKIPFSEIPIGKSVIIPFGVVKESYLRIMVSNASQMFFPKRFACKKHKDHDVFEVGRLADVDTTTELKSLQQFDSSKGMTE